MLKTFKKCYWMTNLNVSMNFEQNQVTQLIYCYCNMLCTQIIIILLVLNINCNYFGFTYMIVSSNQFQGGGDEPKNLPPEIGRHL